LKHWREEYARFAEAVRERLEKGERVYQGRTFDRHPEEILGELLDELRDAAAYAFIAASRVEAMRAAARELELRRPEEHRPSEERADPGVENDRGETHAPALPLGVRR
jgi:hypothetical protein